MQFNVAIGDAIRAIRMEKGMTLRDLSAKSNTSLGYLSEIERGTKDASSLILECIAKGLGVPLYTLVSKASYEMMVEYELDKMPQVLDKVVTW